VVSRACQHSTASTYTLHNDLLVKMLLVFLQRSIITCHGNVDQFSDVLNTHFHRYYSTVCIPYFIYELLLLDSLGTG
jgi:subtilase family serine protease